MEVKLTEVMTYPVEDKGKGCFTLSSFKKLIEFVEDKDVIVIGPGLSQFGETMEMVRKLFTEVKKPFVIDADGINAFQGHLNLLRKGEGRSSADPASRRACPYYGDNTAGCQCRQNGHRREVCRKVWCKPSPEGCPQYPLHDGWRNIHQSHGQSGAGKRRERRYPDRFYRWPCGSGIYACPIKHYRRLSSRIYCRYVVQMPKAI